MNEPTRTVAETALMGVALFLVAWGANGVYPDGLLLKKDYFLELAVEPTGPDLAGESDVASSSENGGKNGGDDLPGPSGTDQDGGGEVPATENGAGGAAEESPDEIEKKVTARLEAAGLQVLPHDGVVELFKDPIYADGAFVFVDARNDDHFAAGHIPGAYQFDHFRMERYVNEVVPAAKGAIQVVVYCYGMDCTDSEIAARHLKNFGVDPSMLFVYVGGIQRWCKEGHEVETGPRGSGQIGKCAE